LPNSAEILDVNVAIQEAQETARRTMKDQLVVRKPGAVFAVEEMCVEGPWPNVEATIIVRKKGTIVSTYTFTKVFDFQAIPR